MVHAEKLLFGRTELEYLSYWITRDGDQPLQKIQATLIIMKYGWLSGKEAETIPWQNCCVDQIGPYKVQHRFNNQELALWCLTMIDPATGQMESKKYKTSRKL